MVTFVCVCEGKLYEGGVFAIISRSTALKFLEVCAPGIKFWGQLLITTNEHPTMRIYILCAINLRSSHFLCVFIIYDTNPKKICLTKIFCHLSKLEIPKINFQEKFLLYETNNNCYTKCADINLKTQTHEKSRKYDISKRTQFSSNRFK